MNSNSDDFHDVLDEYDFSNAAAMRGKYAARYAEGVRLPSDYDGDIRESLAELTSEFAIALKHVDMAMPVGEKRESGAASLAGRGSRSDAEAIKLICAELERLNPQLYGGYALEVPYPESPRRKCDLCLGPSVPWVLAVEITRLRPLGDNGTPKDSTVMQLLSPYEKHNSAIPDAGRLAGSSIAKHKAILFYGFETLDWPLGPVIESFEVLARERVHIGPRNQASFQDLVHPIYNRGMVYAWEIKPPTA